LKLLCSIILAAAIAAGFVTIPGCRGGNDGGGHVFRYDLPVNPRTLDPQTAVDSNARLVIANIFDGLLRMEPSGFIVPGVAHTYIVSDDYMTYTFLLREDVFWMDGHGFYAQCTAHDFVFAFRRLFNPEVRSHHAEDYFAILNAQAVNNGEFPLGSIGVYAEDDFTLIIQLERPEPNLPALLTMPPAFPCNEEFYLQTAGRYGLITAESPVASNGGFFLREWVYDPWWTYENRIVLRRNEKNSESESVHPLGVNFRLSRGDPFDNFTAGETDGIIVSGNRVDDLIRRGFPYITAENTVWGLSFNTSGIFANDNLRQALTAAVDRDAIDFDVTGFRAAATVIPGDIVSGEAQADRFESNYTVEITQNPVLIVPENDIIVGFVAAIAQQWQMQLSLFCRIEVLPYTEYITRLADGDYDIAAVRITANFNCPTSIYRQLLPDSADISLDSGVTISTSFEFIPFSFESQHFFSSTRSEGLAYNPFMSAVFFRNGKVL